MLLSLSLVHSLKPMTFRNYRLVAYYIAIFQNAVPESKVYSKRKIKSQFFSLRLKIVDSQPKANESPTCDLQIRRLSIHKSEFKGMLLHLKLVEIG
jgi:hypothetical protein